VVLDCIVRYGKNNASSSDKRLPWAAPNALTNYGNQNSYTDAPNNYSGRLPMYVPTSDAATTNNLVQSSTGYRLLENAVCPGWDSVDEFWNNWKDQIFYAVAKAFAPNSPVASDANPCLSEECLTVDGLANVAAVVIFSGRKQTGQSRNNNANPSYASADKNSPANFLEGINATAIVNNSPSIASPRQFSKLSGNDIIMCVRFDTATGLYADPTCESTSACTSDGSFLASKRDGNTNNCKVGKDDVDPLCKAAENRIHQNNCTCHKAGHDFNSKECLKGFNPPGSKCDNAYTSLASCS
jgi:hypothetical protein